MKLLKPDAKCRYLTDITPATVKALGCRAVLIDADNTSSYDLTTDPLHGGEAGSLRLFPCGFHTPYIAKAHGHARGPALHGHPRGEPRGV